MVHSLRKQGGERVWSHTHRRGAEQKVYRILCDYDLKKTRMEPSRIQTVCTHFCPLFLTHARPSAARQWHKIQDSPHTFDYEVKESGSHSHGESVASLFV